MKNQKGFAPPIIFVLVILGLVGYFGYKYIVDKYNLGPIYWERPRYHPPSQTPTILPNQPAPKVTSWQKYTDQTYNKFSFEYPGFMPQFIETTSKSTYFTSESSEIKTMINGEIEYSTWLIWKIEHESYGNYEHRLDIRVTGPVKDTRDDELLDWLRAQNKLYLEGVQGYAGITKSQEINLNGERAIVTMFQENGVDNYSNWNIYFKTEEGIYRLDLSIQGTEDEIKYYQEIYSKILSTIKFTN